MKRFVLILWLALPLAAQDALDFYIEQAKPVAEHKKLEELAGAWRMTTKMWFGGDAPKVSNGMGMAKMILGGRFLALEASVTGDLDTHSFTIFGYDRRTGDYTMVAYDDLGTYYITAAGKYDEAKKGIVFDGSYAQPPSGKEQKYRFVLGKTKPNEVLFTLDFQMGGKDVRVAETTFTRN